MNTTMRVKRINSITSEVSCRFRGKTRNAFQYGLSRKNIHTIKYRDMNVASQNLIHSGILESSLETGGYITNLIFKGGCMYIFIFCSLNWWHYRKLRNDNDKDDDNDKNI